MVDMHVRMDAEIHFMKASMDEAAGNRDTNRMRDIITVV